MKFYRIWAVVVRHLFAFQRNLDRLSDSFYWPVLDIIIWGLTSYWVQDSKIDVPNFVLVLLTGLVYWQIVWRANYEISVNLLEEFWNQNMVNLFSTPLKVSEWIAAVMIIGFVKMLISIAVGVGAVFLLYHLNILSVGWMTIPFFALLLASGWILGFLGSSFIIYYGQKVQTIAWTMGFLFAPFSAVYYPLSVLPEWIRPISLALPTTYIFEGMREILFKGTMPMDYLIKAMVLLVIYLALSIAFFCFMFEQSRAKGLGRLE